MATTNGAIGAGPSTTKSPSPGGEPFGGGFQPQKVMDVQPPKPEDLQQSYATVVGVDPSPKGWYGSMSM